MKLCKRETGFEIGFALHFAGLVTDVMLCTAHYYFDTAAYG